MTPRRALAGFALVLLAVPFSGTAAAQSSVVSAADAASARSAVQNCIDRIGEEKLGLAVMEVRCPELPPALVALGIRPLLIESSRDKFDRDSLRQLPSLIHPATGPAPSLAALGPVLRGLRPSVEPPRSWWQSLLDWLSERLGRKPQTNTSFPWLGNVLKVLSGLQWLWTGIFWATVVGLPIGVGFIVWRELRAMGARSLDDPVTVAKAAPAGAVESRLALLRQAPVAQRPAQLFAMLISRLVAAGRLPPDRSLTHREVARRARLDDAEQRRVIETLARLSERQLYLSETNLPAGADALLARAEDLYTTGWGRPAEH